jgi:hypothetical protein
LEGVGFLRLLAIVLSHPLSLPVLLSDHDHSWWL